jgi:glycerate 2-kinase
MANVVIAPDKFKGCLSAPAVAEALAEGIRTVCPSVDIALRPIADGGEGTVDAVVSAGFSRLSLVVAGPIGAPVSASFARRGTVAVVEMAEASGLARLPEGERAALDASTFGTGQLIAGAVAAGCREIVVGLGGSATTDGGVGMLQALGFRFLDGRGASVGPGGRSLGGVVSVDTSAVPDAVRAARFTVASDVLVPLCGPTGAAAMFGPQKGASSADILQLEAGLGRLAVVVAEHLGVDHAVRPGAGAAGGTGFALLSLLGALMRPGVEVVMDAVGFDDVARGAGLFITGEGAVDDQTLQGKAPMGVLHRAQLLAPGAPVVIVGGKIKLKRADLVACGFTNAYALLDRAKNSTDSVRRAAVLLSDVGASIARRHLA